MASCRAIISRSKALTPTVRALELLIAAEDAAAFTFRAGQLVDLQAPGVEQLGGFSMCSSPASLPTVELAVKDAPNWAPARWCNRDAQVGDAVELRVGGDLTIPPSEADADLLLIAGGIGINPLLSMLRDLADSAVPQYGMKATGTGRRQRAHLMYSASSFDELAFLPEIQAMVKKALRYSVNITAEMRVTGDGAGWTGRRGRFGAPDVASAVASMSEYGARSDAKSGATLVPARPTVYLCGPPPMIDELSEHALSEGVPEARVRYERWW